MLAEKLLLKFYQCTLSLGDWCTVCAKLADCQVAFLFGVDSRRVS